MKLLFDQNISYRILKLLSSNFKDSTTVKTENLVDSTDKEIWDFAGKFGYTIVTQDSDFFDLTTLYGYPPKIIWIRTGNLGTQSLAAILNMHEAELSAFKENENQACFEIFAIKG